MSETTERLASDEERKESNTHFAILVAGTVVLAIIGNILQRNNAKNTNTEPAKKSETVSGTNDFETEMGHPKICMDFDACIIYAEGEAFLIQSIDWCGKRATTEEIRDFLKSTEPTMAWDRKTGLRIQNTKGIIEIPEYVIRSFLDELHGKSARPSDVDNIICTARKCGIGIETSCTVICEKQAPAATAIASSQNNP